MEDNKNPYNYIYFDKEVTTSQFEDDIPHLANWFRHPDRYPSPYQLDGPFKCIKFTENISTSQFLDDIYCLSIWFDKPNSNVSPLVNIILDLVFSHKINNIKIADLTSDNKNSIVNTVKNIYAEELNLTTDRVKVKILDKNINTNNQLIRYANITSANEEENNFIVINTTVKTKNPIKSKLDNINKKIYDQVESKIVEAALTIKKADNISY